MPDPSDGAPSITLSLNSPAVVRSLRLTNGYPKRDPCKNLYRFYQFERPTRFAIDFNNGEAQQFVDVEDTSSPQRLELRSRRPTDEVSITVLAVAPADASQLVAGVQDAFEIPAIAELGLTGLYSNR